MMGKRLGKILGGIFGMLLGGLIAICAFYEPVFTRNPEVYYHLPVTLASAPKVEKASRRPDDLVFRFREYPGIYFGAEHNYFSSDYPEKLQAGDTVTIIVLKSEYKYGILKKGNVFKRMIAGRPDLYGFIRNGKNYINIDKIADDSLNPIIVYIVIGIMSTSLLIGGFKAIFLNR